MTVCSVQWTAPAVSADRSAALNPSARLRSSLTNSWNCNRANCRINARNIYKRCIYITARLTWNPKLGDLQRLHQNRAAVFPAQREKFRSETRACMYTWQESKDRCQVITTLTPSDGGLKCLPPDWSKELSNGSSNKPDHMLLDNKYSSSFFFNRPFNFLQKRTCDRLFLDSHSSLKHLQNSHFTLIFNESISSSYTEQRQVQIQLVWSEKGHFIKYPDFAVTWDKWDWWKLPSMLSILVVLCSVDQQIPI